MSETRIVLGLGPSAALLWRHDRNRRSIEPCPACSGKHDGDAGFCADCLDRSRILDDDDIGGES